MKLKKEILYVPIYLIVIYLFESFLKFEDKNLHFIVEFICLFLTGIFIGIDKEFLTNQISKIGFDKVRFILTFVPLSVFLLILIGNYFVQNTKLPYFLVRLQGIIMYKQVGMVLVGYFLTSSIKLEYINRRKQ